MSQVLLVSPELYFEFNESLNLDLPRVEEADQFRNMIALYAGIPFIIDPDLHGWEYILLELPTPIAEFGIASGLDLSDILTIKQLGEYHDRRRD